MTHEIIAMPSGFYGISVCGTNAIIRADLIPWDGIKGAGGFAYDVSSSESFSYYIDANNTVYYSPIETDECCVWCPGSKLMAHCRHLEQIKAR